MAHLILEIATAQGIMGNLLRHTTVAGGNALLVNNLLCSEQDAALKTARETENASSLNFAVRVILRHWMKKHMLEEKTQLFLPGPGKKLNNTSIHLLRVSDFCRDA